MNPLYNIGLGMYAFGAKVAARRSAKIAKMIAGQRSTLDVLRERFPDGEPRDGQSPLIWIHASSLGEFEQGRPLIEAIKRANPKARVCLSFFSPSGYEVRKDYDLADAVVYLPFDTPRRAESFIDTLRPDIAIFIKYEFWGNYLTGLHRRGVPTYLISAIFRPSQIFFKPWGRMFRKLLGCFDHIYVQDERSVALLKDVGVTAVTRTGDTRLDRVNDVMASAPSVDLADFGRRADMKIIVGSSWGADEEHYLPWLNTHPGVAAVIAPHEFNDARLRALSSRIEGKVVLLSEWEKMTPDQRPTDARAIIVDSFGKLAALYRFGDVAYVGGGFGAGIHNINEAAVYGIPVIFGPRHNKFKEASDLIALGAAYAVDDTDSLSTILDTMLADKSRREQAGAAAAKYIRANLGATAAIHSSIFKK